MNQIDGHTRLLGLIGNPVEHTLSPSIHNFLADRLCLNVVYVPLLVKEEGLDRAVKGAYELNVLGMNVTVPHKTRVMGSLADLDPLAEKIGAVNTLVRTEGGYKGYNTDALGLLRAMRSEKTAIRGENVVVLGAGGASMAAVSMLADEGADRIYLCNRNVEKAGNLAERVNRGAGRSCVTPLSLDGLKSIPDGSYLALQCTSVGLYPDTEAAVTQEKDFYRKIHTAVDLIYKPAETRFMRLAKESGAKAYNGLKMLLYQGITAFELFNGVTVPKELTRELYEKLKREQYGNILLIGFMGAGKSSVGKYLARKRAMDFVDTDAAIEEEQGETISDIFERSGEKAFRRMETNYLNEQRLILKNTVVSTGGGMPLYSGNHELMRKLGTVVYLRTKEETILERVGTDTNRPLLQGGDVGEKVGRLLAERTPVYESAADLIVDTDDKNVEELADEILEKVRCFNS